MLASRGLSFFFAAIWLSAVCSFAEQRNFNAADLSSAYREIDLPNGWKQIFPGGETVCARGEEYSFFYRAGDLNDVVIDFVGGGACWSFQTCSENSGTFIDSVEFLGRLIEEEGINGIYDHENEKNPLGDWSHVLIPYCTGDLHWGDNVQTYTNENESFRIFHKGAVNAKAVIDWTFGHHNPDRIFITGTSAGGYASIYWLPNIKEHAPNASVIQFSDGAAGVVVKEPFQEALKVWDVEKHAPTWIPHIDPREVDWNELSLVDVYTEVGRYYSDVILSQFNTNRDTIQMLFYHLMGSQNPLLWSEKAFQSMNQISANVKNFQYYFADGDFHTILPEESFYSLSVDNIKLVDWIQTMIDQTNMGNIVCSECGVESSRD